MNHRVSIDNMRESRILYSFDASVKDDIYSKIYLTMPVKSAIKIASLGKAPLTTILDRLYHKYIILRKALYTLLSPSGDLGIGLV